MILAKKIYVCQPPLVKKIHIENVVWLAYITTMDPHLRFQNYDKDHCWQYEMRQQNLDEDLREAGLTLERAGELRIADFDFEYVAKDDKDTKAEMTAFIERHEWLGKVCQRPSHWFTARLKGTGILAGVIIMGNPYQNATSIHKVLLDGATSSENIERLIARGAGISWSPKNLASWLLGQSTTWMAQNTCTRLFTAYSDVEAKELGTVYQSTNFIYLGQGSGTVKQYFDPHNPGVGWFSDRDFRKLGKLIKYAKQAGYSADQINLYKKGYTLDWKAMPAQMEKDIKDKQKEHRDRCKERIVPPKHRYIQILGATPSETKLLRKRFAKGFPQWTGHDPHRLGLPYPSERGK